jgi:hypothetical protein
MKPHIKVNGKTIQNLDQVPEILQGVLEDKDKNGLPDIADNALKMAGNGGILNQIFLNVAGKSFSGENLPPEAQQKLQEGLAKLSKLTGGNANLQSLLSTFMNGQNGTMNISSDHPTVSVSTSTTPPSMNQVQDNKNTLLNSRMSNNPPENFGVSTKKASSTMFTAQQKQNNKYFQSTPLNPLGGVNSLISPAKGKGGGAIFFVAFALVIGWGIYELNKNGMLEKIMDALNKL